MGIKLLVSGFESSGKSTITSQIKDVFVINCDNKDYPYAVPHTRISEYRGASHFTTQITEAIKRYKEKKGELPKVLVIDTITQLYANMTRYNSKAYSGYNIHNMNSSDTLDINHYLEHTVLPKMDLIIVAHIKDINGTITIPANGAFKDSGSWLSVVNNAIYIDKSSGELIVHTKGFGVTARSTIPNMENEIPIEKYDINAHLDKLREANTEISDLII